MENVTGEIIIKSEISDDRNEEEQFNKDKSDQNEEEQFNKDNFCRNGMKTGYQTENGRAFNSENKKDDFNKNVEKHRQSESMNHFEIKKKGEMIENEITEDFKSLSIINTDRQENVKEEKINKSCHLNKTLNQNPNYLNEEQFSGNFYDEDKNHVKCNDEKLVNSNRFSQDHRMFRTCSICKEVLESRGKLIIHIKSKHNLN